MDYYNNSYCAQFNLCNRNYFFLGIVAAFAGIVAVTIGFAIWDRRTALAPAIRRNRELKEREERIEKALREFAEKEPRLADALSHVGLL